MISDSDDKINFPHEILLTNREVSKNVFIKLLLTNHQLILGCQKLKYLR